MYAIPLHSSSSYLFSSFFINNNGLGLFFFKYQTGFQALDACSGVESWHAVEFMLSQLIITEQWPVNWLLLKELTYQGHAQQKQTVNAKF